MNVLKTYYEEELQGMRSRLSETLKNESTRIKRLIYDRADKDEEEKAECLLAAKSFDRVIRRTLLKIDREIEALLLGRFVRKGRGRKKREICDNVIQGSTKD